ncbi:hypothetical protein ACP059_18700 [Bacillus cabrialesii]|uniref:hypothetical protein n=1 Tax=Bacillus cabrialesii TaxID=2487276 RepID=UPI003CEDDFAD
MKYSLSMGNQNISDSVITNDSKSVCVFYKRNNGVSFSSFSRKDHGILSFSRNGRGNLYRTTRQRTKNHQTNRDNDVSVHVNDDST